MSSLSIIALQTIALIAIIEMFVRLMPTALRQASEQNCYRADGTCSKHRSYRELRACNRLRRDMFAVLALVFLTSNAVVFAVDSVTPVGNIAVRLYNGVFGGPDNPSITQHQNELINADQRNKPISSDQFNRYWPWLVAMAMLWVVGCFIFVGWGAMRAYQSFAEGVSSRNAEHLNLDMARMHEAEYSEFKVSRRSDTNQDVA